MSRVFVFQMGKVGSTSLFRAVDGLQVHHLNWSTWLSSVRGGRYKHQRNSLLMRLMRPKKIITAVREPIGRNISAFMQNHKDWNWEPTMESFLTNFRHDEPLLWFDLEMKPFTGIDVFEHPFPRDRGWQIIDDQLLILKAEAPNIEKEMAASEFLGREVHLGYENVSSAKGYSDEYDEVRSAPLPREYVDRMLGARYTRHFYSESEIEILRTSYYQRGFTRG